MRQCSGMTINTSINFYLHYNVNYSVDGKTVFKKAEGIFAHTELELNEDGSIGVDRYSFGNGRFYIDKEGDGQVDKVSQYSLFTRGPHSRHFDRKKHLEQYQDVFRKADEDFRRQLDRFGLFLDR